MFVYLLNIVADDAVASVAVVVVVDAPFFLKLEIELNLILLDRKSLS